MIRVMLALLAALMALPAAAQDSMPPAPYAYNQLEDPAKEAEAAALMATLRCLKCQSQSIADSDAPMAGDMRHQVRSRIRAEMGIILFQQMKHYQNIILIGKKWQQKLDTKTFQKILYAQVSII